MKTLSYNRGDVIEAKPAVVFLDDIKGNVETSQTRVQVNYRPYLVIGERVTLNHPLLVVCAITKTKRGNYPFIQEIELKQRSYIHYEQLFTIDKKEYRFVRKLHPYERQEMELKCSYCIGGSKTNVLNIEGVNHLKEEINTIEGVLQYKLGLDSKFILLKSAYRNQFGVVQDLEDITNKLNSVAGIRLILQEGGVV